MPTKCTALFQLATSVSTPNATQRRLGGWSETVYSLLTSPSQIQFVFENLCQARAALLPRGALIVGQRYQQVSPTGTSTTGAKVYPGSASLDADVPQMCLNMRCPGVGVRNIRPIQLRGIPDARVVEGEYEPSLAFEAALAVYTQKLFNFAFKGRDLAALQWPLFTIDANGVYVTEAVNTLVVGDMVRVLRATTTSLRQVGGRFMVSAVTTTRSGTITPWTEGAVKGGRIRVDNIIYPLFVESGAIGRVITTKKVGRPFNQYRGRASRRR